MEAQRQGHTQRLEEIHVQADVADSRALYAMPARSFMSRCASATSVASATILCWSAKTCLGKGLASLNTAAKISKFTGTLEKS